MLWFIENTWRAQKAQGQREVHMCARSYPKKSFYEQIKEDMENPRNNFSIVECSGEARRPEEAPPKEKTSRKGGHGKKNYV